MDNKFVEFQSKMLVAVLKAFKVEPTLPGLITSIGGDPAEVFAMVDFVQKNGVRMTQAFETAVTNTAARVERIEAEQRQMHAILIELAMRAGITEDDIGKATACIAYVERNTPRLTAE